MDFKILSPLRWVVQAENRNLIIRILFAEKCGGYWNEKSEERVKCYPDIDSAGSMYGMCVEFRGEKGRACDGYIVACIWRADRIAFE
jgi:hypothetical protein